MASTDILVRKYRSKGVVVDANLLLLYVIGLHDPGLIPRFKRTQSFTAQDFELLHLLLGEFRRHFTTPSVLTEVSNLSRQMHGEGRLGVAERFEAVIRRTREHFVLSAKLSIDRVFPRLGLTDTAILDEAGHGRLLLTDDLDLYVEAQIRGLDAMNFNHVRSWFWERG